MFSLPRTTTTHLKSWKELSMAAVTVYWRVEVYLHSFITWVVSFTSQPPYNRGNSTPYPFYRKLGGPQSRSGRFGEDEIIFPPLRGIEPRFFGLPACSLVTTPTNLTRPSAYRRVQNCEITKSVKSSDGQPKTKIAANFQENPSTNNLFGYHQSCYTSDNKYLLDLKLSLQVQSTVCPLTNVITFSPFRVIWP
jgi:hypothetical protein